MAGMGKALFRQGGQHHAKRYAPPDNRSYRLLDLYKRLQQGEVLSKRELADKYRVSEKTVQRDIEGLREYLAGEQSYLELVYDKEAGGYRISRESAEGLQPEEVFAVCKILLESRPFPEDGDAAGFEEALVAGVAGEARCRGEVDCAGDAPLYGAAAWQGCDS